MIMIPKVAAEKGISQLSTESGISYMQNKCLWNKLSQKKLCLIPICKYMFNLFLYTTSEIFVYSKSHSRSKTKSFKKWDCFLLHFR